MRSRSWKWWLVIGAIVVALAFAPGFVSGLKKTPKNRVGISYGGGPFEAAHFQRVVKPGSSLFFNGFFDPLYLYPSDQQNYIISKKQGVGAQKSPDSIVAPTKDRVQVTYEVALYFKLDTDLLRRFHEELGLRYSAYTSAGWYNLIRDTFRQQIENALQEETRQVDVADLFGNAQLLVELQNRVQAQISQRLQEALGARFFCSPSFEPGGKCGDPTFIVKSVTIPNTVAKAFQDNRISAIRILTKQNEIQQREAEAQAIRALGLTGQEYDVLKAIESGKISFWVLPNNGGVTITGPSPSGSSAAGSSPSPSTTPTTRGR
ncbi:MAG: SPFH domain-containing protein [Acidimicrobiia bacterium]|nr:SPFH domain-containing protein [Acidimicrobiia bacterium]